MSNLDTFRRMQEQEFLEYPFRGPFGGIQSELPLDEIELFGFSDCVNVLLRNAVMRPRPGLDFVDPLPFAPVGITDFYDVNGVRHSVAWTREKMYEYIGITPTELTGVLTGADTDLMSWAVVNNNILFSQGIDVVQAWDGVTAGFADASVDAVPARFLLELATHLLVARTIEGGNEFTQRVRWTAPGDFTDWTGFSAGVNDILNSLGPITGLTKIFENGFALHPDGVTRIVPTGIGTRPFDFIPYNDRTRGCFFPHSVASFGDNGTAYVTRSDVVMFNGSSFQSLGAQPADDGRKRVGARSRIISDLLLADPTQVYGFGTQAIGGSYFQAYWLIIPNVSMWVYNLDESNWTRFAFPDVPKVMGRISISTGVRIMDLIGTIAEQNWTPATLSSETFFDSPAIGFTNGEIGMPNFGVAIESGYQVASGTLVMNDRRHNKRVEKVRILYQDGSPTPLTLTLLNDRGEIRNYDFTLVGNGTGFLRQQVIPVDMSGMFIRWQITGIPNTQAIISEVTPIYNIGGEYKNY